MPNFFSKRSQNNPVSEDIIGEVLVGRKDRNGGYGYCSPQSADSIYLEWQTFKVSNYDPYRNHDGFVSIWGIFFKEEDVIFYKKELFKDLKAKIERRYSNDQRKS